AISSFTLHNTSSSPTLSVSVVDNSSFTVRSHTREPIEYVQDSFTDACSVPSTTAPSAAELPPAAATLLLKVRAGEGFRLSFQLKGHIPALMSCVAQESTNARNNSGADATPKTEDDDNVSASEIPCQATAYEHPHIPENSGVSPSGTNAKNATTKDDTNVSQSPSTLYFAECCSEQDVQDLCQESEFQKQLKDHAISTVVVLPPRSADQEHKTQNWSWNYVPKDRVEGDLSGHKTVFAFLKKDISTNSIVVLSQFALWIANHCSGTSYATLSSSHAGNNSRHWRRASTPERYSSGVSRIPSLHSKGLSVPSSHSSLSSLPDSASGTGGSGNFQDGPACIAGQSSTLNSAPISHDTEDGPLFRATVVECENHIRDMKASTKRIIKAAQGVLDARRAWVAAEEAFVKEMEGFKPAEPLLSSYLRPMSESLSERSDIMAHQMRNLLIEPLSRFYGNDIKAAEANRKAFDDESREYYQFLSRYMAMKQESNRKKSEADAKYEKKRRHFEVKRFEYWCFLLDMRVGGSKSDEILHHLTTYSEKHCKLVMDMALLADSLKPGLDGIASDLLESHKRAAALRKERQERRKELLESHDDSLGPSQLAPFLTKSGSSLAITNNPAPSSSADSPDVPSDGNLDIPTITQEPSGEILDSAAGSDSRAASATLSVPSSVFGAMPLNNTSSSRLSSVRDQEHPDDDTGSIQGRRKEGFLFATSRPSMHNNSAVLEKPNINWHKYWCVVSEGHLHEYSHWKKGATMLHNEPINLKISTVRPCRNQDRRFCFEVITPKYRRVYQATSTEDMNSWISVISNAIQSLLDGTSSRQNLGSYPLGKDSKPSGVPGVDGLMSALASSGRQSVDLSPSSVSAPSHGNERSQTGNTTNSSNDLSKVTEVDDMEHLGTRLLQLMREANSANNICAECGAKNPDWCAINLGILICIDCSGIHRSLGTHISKVRSFTLDTTSYTRDLFEFIRSMGNEASNRIWEANIIQLAQETDSSEKTAKAVYRRPTVSDTRDYKVTFIRKKYVERAFISHLHIGAAESSEERGELATKALFRAAIANDLVGVIAAFAAGADLNAVQEADMEAEGDTPGPGHVAMDSDDTTESLLLSDSKLQSALESLPPGSEVASRLARSTAEAENSPGVDSQACRLEARSSSVIDLSGSFRVMQTSPLLLALRHAIPFSLDDQYEVYPMAEFMLQNGAASNLSVEVRLIDDASEAVSQAPISDTATDGTSITTTDPACSGHNNGWDSSHVDPEDIRHHQQRTNRRSLGQVVHMRGEEGATAMEYLRAKSAARGEPIPGSPPNSQGSDTASAAGSTSPGSVGAMALSPRLRAQGPSMHNGPSSSGSALASPSVPGKYATNVHRQPSISTHQDISSLFQGRRKSDSGHGQALLAAARAAEADKSARATSTSKTGEFALQSAAAIASSPVSSHDYMTESSSGHLTPLPGHSASSRANKVKASLSKSLRLSAAYIKNNMMKDDKEFPLPNMTQTTATLPTASSEPKQQQQSDASSSRISIVSTASIDGSSSPSVSSGATGSQSDAPLSGPYVILHAKGSSPSPSASPKFAS
ncbi:hypothetical protein BGX28_009383, partial [Mortierella sp. GBA30]